MQRKRTDNTMAREKRTDNAMAREERIDNTMAREKGQIIQWPEKKDTQYNGQRKRTKRQTMVN